ncbi:MAG: hypothetical protein M3041_05550 [Acidobacteriota bacterium]|nr:hypothetical protein [Acidobacteriota bacterium]
MRHVPALGSIIEKLDVDLRRRIDKLVASIGAQPSNEAADFELRGLCRAIDRLADAAKFSRPTNHAPAEIGARIIWAINHAVSSLGSLDANLFGRRYPFQTLERSKGETLYGALLVVIDHVHRLTALARKVDPSIDERLLEGLVVLQEPLREQRMA